MTLPIGTEAWLRAWTTRQRDETVLLARRRSRLLTGWITVGLTGLVAAGTTVATGQPGVDGLPPQPAVPVAVALVVDVAVLAFCRAGWRAVADVFTGRRPAAVLRSMRTRTAVAALVALLVSLFAAVWGGITPAVALLRSQAGWTDLTTGVAVALAVACAVAAMRLWVTLLPVTPPPNPPPER